MIKRKYSIAGCSVFAGVAMLLMLSILSIAQEIPTSLLSDFRHQDNKVRLLENGRKKVNMGFVASFLMTTTHPLDPAQGNEIKHCTVSWTADSCAIKIISDYDHQPVFRPKRILGYEAIDYDGEGNLIVWRSIEKYIISTKDRNDAVEKLAQHCISPDGDILRTNIYTQLYRYPIGSPDNTYLFDQFCLATGRGLSKYLTEITTGPLKSLPKDLRSVKAVGSYGENLEGEWTITFDQDSDYLIREGTFTADGLEEPVVELISSGLIKCPGLTIAESGVFRTGIYKAQFQVLSLKNIELSKANANPLLSEALKHVTASLPSGASEVVDYRDKIPKRIPTK